MLASGGETGKRSLASTFLPPAPFTSLEKEEEHFVEIDNVVWRQKMCTAEHILPFEQRGVERM